MRVRVIRDTETNTSSTKLVINNKTIDFDYPELIKRLYTGETIEDVEFEPEGSFDQTERSAINKMLDDISTICKTAKEPKDTSDNSSALEED